MKVENKMLQCLILGALRQKLWNAPHRFFCEGTRGMKVKCYAKCSGMLKQVSNKNSKHLQWKATLAHSVHQTLSYIYAFAIVSHCSHKVCLRQFCAPSLLRLGVQQAGGAKVAPSTVVSYAIESSVHHRYFIPQSLPKQHCIKSDICNITANTTLVM